MTSLIVQLPQNNACHYLRDFLLIFRDSPPCLHLCCLCRVHRCSTAPSTAGRSPSAGVGVLRSRCWCPCQSGGGWAPLRPGAYEGTLSHRRRASLTTPSMIPLCNVWLPPFRKKTEGTPKVTFYFSFRGVHKTIENGKNPHWLSPALVDYNYWLSTSSLSRVHTQLLIKHLMNNSWRSHCRSVHLLRVPSARASKRWTCSVCVTLKLISCFI